MFDQKLYKQPSWNFNWLGHATKEVELEFDIGLTVKPIKPL